MAFRRFKVEAPRPQPIPVKSVSIVIPVYNEAPTVTELLEQVWSQPLEGVRKEVVIVESNSTDGSRELVKQFVESKKEDSSASVKVIYQDRPRGKGAAMREGFAHATGDVILIQDADLEYDTNDYAAVIAPIQEGHAEFVLGSRHMAAGTWRVRKFESRPSRAFVFNFSGIIVHGLFNLIYHQKLTDPTTMYKVFRRSCLQKFDLVSNRFDFDLELVAKLILAGFKPIEVPISYDSRSFEEGKKVRFFQDGIKILWAIIKYRFAPLKNN